MKRNCVALRKMLIPGTLGGWDVINFCGLQNTTMVLPRLSQGASQRKAQEDKRVILLQTVGSFNKGLLIHCPGKLSQSPPCYLFHH